MFGESVLSNLDPQNAVKINKCLFVYYIYKWLLSSFFGGSSVNSIDEIWKCMDEIWIGSWAERIVALGNRLCKGSGFLFYAFVLLWRL